MGSQQSQSKNFDPGMSLLVLMLLARVWEMIRVVVGAFSSLVDGFSFTISRICCRRGLCSYQICGTASSPDPSTSRR